MAVVTPYLLVEDLTKSVGSKVLFSNISFAVNKGQRIALIARNGIGKSTLLDILMGILATTAIPNTRDGTSQWWTTKEIGFATAARR